MDKKNREAVFRDQGIIKKACYHRRLKVFRDYK